MVRSNKGFTLIELMVVIVIMGVLAVLAIPKLTDVITKAKIGEVPIVLGSWEHAQMAYIAEKGGCASNIDDLAYDKPDSSKWFSYAQTGDSSAVTYTATVKSGRKVGNFTSSSDGATSTITDASVVTHGKGAFTKYLANF
ncbi:MAG TPA: prepilin-type N-terminal cleavage/methylation domain-containing protein [Chitinispirillaceae bacterium]|nr:prepilin-type N-terminal cleavage/methylation domain-containing protein [Chitinispirillaceae bacterium]